MLRRYRNALIDTIRSADFDPRDFKPSEEELNGFLAFVLTYKDTPMKFVIRTSRDDLHALDCAYSLFAPGHPLSGYVPRNGFAGFDVINVEFTEWLSDALRDFLEEETAPDLWAQLQIDADNSGLLASQDVENTPFSDDERVRIREGLVEAQRTLVESNDLTETQVTMLSERIEYLIESSERLGRKDWLSAAAGALIGLVVQAGLTSDTARQLFHLASAALRWITHSPLLLP